MLAGHCTGILRKALRGKFAIPLEEYWSGREKTAPIPRQRTNLSKSYGPASFCVDQANAVPSNNHGSDAGGLYHQPREIDASGVNLTPPSEVRAGLPPPFSQLPGRLARKARKFLNLDMDLIPLIATRSVFPLRFA